MHFVIEFFSFVMKKQEIKTLDFIPVLNMLAPVYIFTELSVMPGKLQTAVFRASLIFQTLFHMLYAVNKYQIQSTQPRVVALIF